MGTGLGEQRCKPQKGGTRVLTSSFIICSRFLSTETESSSCLSTRNCKFDVATAASLAATIGLADLEQSTVMPQQHLSWRDSMQFFENGHKGVAGLEVLIFFQLVTPMTGLVLVVFV